MILTSSPMVLRAPMFREAVPFCIAFLTILLTHLLLDRSSEPYFNNDETRHVMTGAFFRDAIVDGGWKSPRAYATRYYLQYPALGLMVWPPFFYAVEGGMMSVFGISFGVALATLALFGLMGAIAFYAIARTVFDRFWSTTSLILLGISPLIFTFSRQVMLELPTLSLSLVSLYFFERYLCVGRGYQALLACVAAALAALTRFDAVFLLVYFLIRLGMSGSFALLTRRSVVGGVLVALVLTGPYYYLTWREYGAALGKAAQEGTNAARTSFLAPENVLFYPGCVPEQLGWLATIFAVLGLLRACTIEPHRWGTCIALLMATYVTFTPLAEIEARHAIYWVPALALFAMLGAQASMRWLAIRFSVLSQQTGLLAVLAAFALIAGTAVVTARQAHQTVHGYEDAARLVLQHRTSDRPCLMDGLLNGSFIFHVRKHDPARQLWVLRGDKLLYGVLSDPTAEYKQWAKSQDEVLEVLERYDPEWIVVEEPQLFFQLAGATLLRDTLKAHPEQFRREYVVPIRSDYPSFRGARLELYRKVQRNPNRTTTIEYEMLNLRRGIGSSMP